MTNTTLPSFRRSRRGPTVYDAKMKRPWQRVLGAATAAIVTMLWAAPGAAAEPPDPGVTPVHSPTFALADLGSSNTISFNVNRDLTSSSLNFPVPPGLSPVALLTTLEVPANLRSGKLTVTQNDRTISRMELPAHDQAQLVIPLTGVQVSGNWVNITVTISALAPDGYCWNPLAPIRFVNTAVTFTGAELAPTSIATFLPPVVRKLIIAIPAKPSQPESDAAVQLAATMTMRYGGQHPGLTVVALPDGSVAPPNPTMPFERQIVIKEGPDKGLSLQGDAATMPTLLISGPGNELTNQARLLSDDSLQYALSRKAIAGILTGEKKFADATTTLQQLNGSGLTSEAMWPQVGIDVDQSRFGRPLKDIRVHLIGSHTPLPNNFGGEIIVSVDGQTVERWPAPADGVIDRWVSIPDRLLKRSTTLQVSVHTTGDYGHCGDYLPMLLKIEGSTTIQSNAADQPLPPGFQSLPQALMSPVQIGIGTDAFADTVRAAQIAAGLQETSAVPLSTTVTSARQAIDSGHGAVVMSSDGSVDGAVALPFNAKGSSISITGLDVKGQATTLTLEPAIHAGSLQTVYDGKRTLLVATSNGAPEQLDTLLQWLSSERGRWSNLNGRAIISVPGREPVTVPNPPTDIWAPAPSTAGTHNFEWWIVGGIAAVAAAGAVIILRRTRRSIVPSAPDANDGSDD